MLDSLSFLHSSPPVFSSMNTVNPSFLYSKIYNQKDTKPVKKQRENRSWVQWAMLARPTIFFPTAFRVGSIPFFLNFDDIEKIRAASIQSRTPLLFWVFRKVFRSCSNQNISLYLSVFIFRIATENKVKIGIWRSISDARQFIFFTQFSARIQFSEYG